MLGYLLAGTLTLAFGYDHYQQRKKNIEPVAPLRDTSSPWNGNPVALSSKTIAHEVEGLLSKLPMGDFDATSNLIILWVNKCEQETDDLALIQIFRLIFEKATDDERRSEVYARLCRKIMEQISPKVRDVGLKNNDGKPIAGGQLFRKYLLNRCQEDFERGWMAKETPAAAAASKAAEDGAVKAANDKTREDGREEEIVLYSEEYYAAQKAKRQGLGLIKFIGELFKLQMLTERIMHECVKKLLGNADNPKEEEIESLCKLLTTVGGILDTPKARAHLDVYFARMKELIKSQHVSSRMQYMLQDLIELRERKWINRTAVTAPQTIAQIHENAAKGKAAAEKDSHNRQASMSRGGSRRGGDHGDFSQVGPDRWAVAGSGSTVPRPPPKAGDLSNFGKINKNQPMTVGPSSVFAGKKAADPKREALSRANSNVNMFYMPSNQAAEAPKAAAAKFGEPVQRRRLVLQPRSKPVEKDLIGLRERDCARTAIVVTTTIAQTRQDAPKERAAAKGSGNYQVMVSPGGSRLDRDLTSSEGVKPFGSVPVGSPTGHDYVNGRASIPLTSTIALPQTKPKIDAKKMTQNSSSASSSILYFPDPQQHMDPRRYQHPRATHPTEERHNRPSPPHVDTSIFSTNPPSSLQRPRLTLTPSTPVHAHHLPPALPPASINERRAPMPVPSSTSTSRTKFLTRQDVGKLPSTNILYRDGSDNHDVEASRNQIHMAKITEYSDEFFAVRNLEKGANYFATLPIPQHYWLLEYLAASAFKLNESDINLVADLFAHIRAKNGCSTTAFMTAFELLAESHGYPNRGFAKIVKAAKLNATQVSKLASYAEDSERYALLKFFKMAQLVCQNTKIRDSLDYHSLDSQAFRSRIQMDKIVEDSDEFFALRDLEKGESYFSTLPGSRHYWLVEYLVASAIESNNESDTKLVADLFVRIRAKNGCSATAFMTAFELAFELVAGSHDFRTYAFTKMLKAAKLNEAQRFKLVTQKKTRDSEVVSNFFDRLVCTGMCSTALLEGDKDEIISDIIEDLTIFAPEALTKLALMIKGEGLVA